MTHSHEITGSTPVLQQLSHFIWELVGFGSEDENSKISMVTCIKWFLSYYKAATVAIQLDGKHIKSTPNLLFKDNCWRIWLIGGCLEIGTVVTQKCGDDLCTIGGNTASITADRILVISLKLKNRDGIKKQGDRNPSRMVMIGLYSKGTDGQMYTSSFILYETLITTYF